MIQLRKLGWEAVIRPDFGMNTVRLLLDGEDILRFPETEEALQASPCVYGTPILLPANRTAGGCFSFEGRQYRLPVNDPTGGHHIHGILNRTPFTLGEVTECSVEGCYVNEGDAYPFPFRIDVRAWIQQDGYYQQYRFTNTGSQNMPLAFGLHTTFLEKPFLAVPIAEKWERDETLIPTGRLLPLNPAEQRWRDGFAPDGSVLTGFFTAAGQQARIGNFHYRVSANFDQWTLWNGNGRQGFVSVEPQQGAVNALNSGRGLLVLAPGQTEIFQTCIGKVSG